MKLRQAEMELKKGQNMVDHQAEIQSRPARTWFQSGKEKEKAQGNNESSAVRRKLNNTLPRLQNSASSSTRLASRLFRRRKRVKGRTPGLQKYGIVSFLDIKNTC